MGHNHHVHQRWNQFSRLTFFKKGFSRSFGRGLSTGVHGCGLTTAQWTKRAGVWSLHNSVISRKTAIRARHGGRVPEGTWDKNKTEVDPALVVSYYQVDGRLGPWGAKKKHRPSRIINLVSLCWQMCVANAKSIIQKLWLIVRGCKHCGQPCP